MPNAIFFYRLSRWFYLKKVPFLPKIFQLLIFLIYNSKIPPSADIGEGSFLVVKGVGVVVIDGAKIGRNCKLGIGCKIVGKGPYKNVANIGDNVFLGPGCVVMGPVVIEDDVIVAANAVVTKSVPKGAVIGGVPAKIIGSVYDLDYDIKKNESYKMDIAAYMQ